MALATKCEADVWAQVNVWLVEVDKWNQRPHSKQITKLLTSKQLKHLCGKYRRGHRKQTMTCDRASPW